MLITSNAMDAADLARSSDMNRNNYTISLQHLTLNDSSSQNQSCFTATSWAIQCTRNISFAFCTRELNGKKTAAKGCMHEIQKTNHNKYLKQLLACTHLGKVRFANLHDFNEKK